MSWFFLPLTAISGAVSLISGILTLRSAITSHPGSKPQQQRFGWSLTISTFFLALVFLFASIPSLQGSNSGNTSTVTSGNSQQAKGVTPGQVTPTPTVQIPTPTPTPTPHDEKMEWTNNWSDWGATGDNWYTSGNSLIATGNGQMVITAPVVPIATDYAVEADITVDNVNGSAYKGGFGILVRSNGGYGGYALSMCYWGGWQDCAGYHDTGHYALLLAGCDFNQYVDGGEGCTVMEVTPYHAPNQQKLTYRLEVRGNTIQAFIGDKPLFPKAVNNTYHTPGQIGLFSQNIGLTVTRFTYIPLS